MATHVSIEKMEQELREILQDYQDLTDEEVETAVRKTANTVKKSIKSEAPEDTGEYEKSWTSRKTTKKGEKSYIRFTQKIVEDSLICSKTVTKW